MGGFIVLEDGRSYAASNAATDLVVSAIAAEVEEPEFAEWLLSQRSEIIGMGMTGIDLREVAPIYREVFYAAVDRAFEKAWALVDDPDDRPAWLGRFGDLVTMIRLWRAGEPPLDFNPHMVGLTPETGRRDGPGWPDDK